MKDTLLRCMLIFIMAAVLTAGFYREYSDSEKVIESITEVQK